MEGTKGTMKKKLFGLLAAVGFAVSIAATLVQTELNNVPVSERSGLTQLEYDVMYRDATERPGSSELLHEKRVGWFVDKVSGERVFHSSSMFDSGTGWPSFTNPYVSAVVTLEKDDSLFMSRIEVRSADGKRHYGHVFQDGPAPTGLRYCMNGAAFRFIPS